MFSQVFVCPKGVSVPACITGHMSRGSLSRGGFCPGEFLSGGGVSVRGSLSGEVSLSMGLFPL